MIGKAIQGINRSVKTLPKFRETEDDSTFYKKANSLVELLNFTLKRLALSKNFDSYIAEVSMIAGEEKTISHFLGVRPKYRIILRQEGNGVLSDIPSLWTEKVAVIKNNGAVAVTATIMFLKE